MPITIGDPGVFLSEKGRQSGIVKGGVPFVPSSSGSLALWLRNNITNYVTGTTQAVDVQTLSSWLDSVGSKSFAQATTASRPRYCFLEGVPVVRFQGSNRSNTLTYTNKVFGNDADFTISIAFRRSARIEVSGATLYSETNSADTSDLFAIAISTTNGSIRISMRDSADHLFQQDGTTRVDDNRVHVVTVSIVGGNCLLYIDGALEFSADYATTVTGWVGATTFNRTSLGSRVSTSTISYLMVDIYEVVGYSTSLSASVLAQHHNYLIGKFVVPTGEICANNTGSPLYNQAVYSASLNKTFIGAFNSNAQPQVTVIDHGVSPATTVTYVIADNVGTDRHDSVAVAFAKSGKLMAFADNHNNNILNFYLSTSVADPSAWGAGTDIGPGSNHAYLHCVTTTEGVNSWRVYVYYRDQSVGSWNFRYSDDDGTTWAAAQVLWQPQGVVNRQIYGRARMCADGNIHFFFGNDDADGIAGTADIYHWMYKPSAAKYYKSDGTTEITSLPFDATDATLVYDSSAHGNRNPSYTGDIMTSGSDIYIATGTSAGVGLARRICRLTYSSGAWALEEVITSNSDFLSASFYPGDKDQLWYGYSDGANLQTYKVVYSGGAWGTPVALTSSDHFATGSQGPFRVLNAENGGTTKMLWQFGHFDDATNGYGELFCYPTVT